MIHTIAVSAGQSSHSLVAQRHAVRMARLFQARLRVATVWDPGSREQLDGGGMSWEATAEDEVRRISAAAGGSDVLIESSLRGEGFLKGLLSEARDSDLLVVGLPDCPTPEEPMCRAIRNQELPLLRHAECMVLVANHDPEPIKRVLVDYHGGTEGKTALRVAGEIAARASSAVTVLSVDSRRDTTELLTSSATRYLAGFGIEDVTGLERIGQPGSESEVLDAAESTGADLVVVGGEGHGVLEWLRGRASAQPEDISAALGRPVLVAR